MIARDVELVVRNPGPSDDEITLYLRDAGGGGLVAVSKIVTVTDCGHVRFAFLNGGLAVSPGQVHSIGLSGGRLFGWKYVADGYSNGAASSNGSRFCRTRGVRSCSARLGLSKIRAKRVRRGADDVSIYNASSPCAWGAAIWVAPLTMGQDSNASKEREIKVPSTAGESYTLAIILCIC